jgi:hypothetical protein
MGNQIEASHICFPITHSVDRLIRTPPGETPPPIGMAMFPQELSRTHKQTTVMQQFDTEATYSISFHSPNLDLVSPRLFTMS